MSTSKAASMLLMKKDAGFRERRYCTTGVNFTVTDVFKRTMKMYSRLSD